MLRSGITAVLGLGLTLAAAQTAHAVGPLFCKLHCPPPLHHWMECCPCIKWHCACPKPICSPCHQPNWGYYQPCWSPWPWPPDWSHCPVMPPAAMVIPPGSGPPPIVLPDSESLAPPRQLAP